MVNLRAYLFIYLFVYLLYRDIVPSGIFLFVNLLSNHFPQERAQQLCHCTGGSSWLRLWHWTKPLHPAQQQLQHLTHLIGL